MDEMSRNNIKGLPYFYFEIIASLLNGFSLGYYYHLYL